MKSALTAIALLCAVFLSAPVAARPLVTPLATQHVRPAQSLQRLFFRGVTSIRARANVAGVVAGASANRFRRQPRGYSAIDVRPEMMQRNFAAARAAIAVPSAPSRGIVKPDSGFFGFSGLTNFDQATAGTGIYAGTQFDLEPPDQGLCVGNGYVVEAINDALAVYTTSGAPVSGAEPLNAFFGLAPEVGTNGAAGPSIGDPECYFDRDTQRWFVTVYYFAVNPATGAFTGDASQLIAVSQTPSPTGNFNVVSFDTTDRGNPGCPCFGDQPLLGADASGIYISTNEFSIFNPPFNGSQVYALSKIALALGLMPTVVHFDLGALKTPDAGGIWYSVHPAITPELNRGHLQQGGTEYFLSSLDFFNKNDDRIATWALSGTSSLWNPTPHVKLQQVVTRSEAYGLPPPAQQKDGPRPLGESVKDPLEKLDSGDDRMHEVVFAQGRLWAGVDTSLRVDGPVQAGIAYFTVAPAFVSGKLGAKVVGEGYVGTAGQNVIYPSIGVNAAGKAIMVGTLSGPKYYPSAFYVPVNAKDDNLRLAEPGLLPDDGFTGYAAFGGAGVGRWGDYSQAVSDEVGNIWIGTEYIPKAPRTKYANWGTFLGEIPGQ